jgi:hypothetical protein
MPCPIPPSPSPHTPEPHPIGVPTSLEAEHAAVDPRALETEAKAGLRHGARQDQADARVLKAVERATPSRGFEIPPLRFVYCKAGVEARLREGAIFK